MDHLNLSIVSRSLKWSRDQLQIQDKDTGKSIVKVLRQQLHGGFSTKYECSSRQLRLDTRNGQSKTSAIPKFHIFKI